MGVVNLDSGLPPVLRLLPGRARLVVILSGFIRVLNDLFLITLGQFHEQLHMRLWACGAPPDLPCHCRKTAEKEKETAERGDDKPIHGRGVRRVLELPCILQVSGKGEQKVHARKGLDF